MRGGEEERRGGDERRRGEVQGFGAAAAALPRILRHTSLGQPALVRVLGGEAVRVPSADAATGRTEAATATSAPNACA